MKIASLRCTIQPIADIYRNLFVSEFPRFPPSLRILRRATLATSGVGHGKDTAAILHYRFSRVCVCSVTTAEILRRVTCTSSRGLSWSRVTVDSDKSPVIRQGKWAARRRSSRDPGAGILFVSSQEVDGDDDDLQRSLLRNRIFGSRR